MNSHNPEKTTTFSPMNSSPSPPHLSLSKKSLHRRIFLKKSLKKSQLWSQVTEQTQRSLTGMDEKKDKREDKEEVEVDPTMA
jgi:hypothetical protein